MNHIMPIILNRGFLESMDEVKEEVHNHFELKLFEPEVSRPVLDGSFYGLDTFERDYIEAFFPEEEIKEAVWICDGTKSPDPNGFSFHFIKKRWFFIKEDFVKCFEDFYSRTFFSKSIISSFLNLVPKSSNPLGLEDYIPICLVGCIYKSFI